VKKINCLLTPVADLF